MLHCPRSSRPRLSTPRSIHKWRATGSVARQAFPRFGASPSVRGKSCERSPQKSARASPTSGSHTQSQRLSKNASKNSLRWAPSIAALRRILIGMSGSPGRASAPPRRDRSAWRGLAALTLLSACHRNPRDAAASAAAAPGSRGSTAAASVSSAPAQLRGFQCTRKLNAGKAPQGQLRAHFLFASADDVTLHLDFHCELNCRRDWGTCDYTADLRGEHGAFKDTFPGAKFRCYQSPVNGFAVECGSLLGSVAQTDVTASSVLHSVRFQAPFTFDQ